MYLILLTISIIAIFEYIYNRFKNIKPIIISIDGNIGSGKSTLLNIMKEQLNQYEYIDEPINDWTNIGDDNGNILSYFYKNKNRWSYTFQNYAFLTRSKRLLAVNNKAMKMSLYDRIFNPSKMIIFTERSTMTDKYVFADMLYKNGNMSEIEWKMYNEWYTLFNESLHIDHVIYLKTDPDKSLERVNKRARSEEKEIKLDYLKELHDKHENWLVNGKNVLTLNGNINFETNNELKKLIINKIKNYLVSV